MSTRLLEPKASCEKRAAAIVEDLSGIVASRLRDDYAGELTSWTFLGRDLVEYLLNCRR